MRRERTWGRAGSPKDLAPPTYAPCVLLLVAVDLHRDRPVRPDPAAVHPLGVERRREVALAIEDDDAAVAVLVGEHAVDHLVRGLRHRLVLVLVARADVARDGVADEELAGAG